MAIRETYIKFTTLNFDITVSNFISRYNSEILFTAVYTTTLV